MKLVLCFTFSNSVQVCDSNTHPDCFVIVQGNIEQDLKNIKNVKRCRDGMPKKYANKVGMI